MAIRRMFSKEVVCTDKFESMAPRTMALYFALGMQADDDGFIPNVHDVMRSVHARRGDMLMLVRAGYVIELEDGIVLIAHWKMNNNIRGDRYTKSVYAGSYPGLALKNKVYTYTPGAAASAEDAQLDAAPAEDVTTGRVSQIRQGKVSSDKDNAAAYIYINKEERRYRNALLAFSASDLAKRIRDDDPELYDKMVAGGTPYPMRYVMQAIDRTAEELEKGRDIHRPMSYALRLAEVLTREAEERLETGEGTEDTE